jgi:hypothetical protein
MHAIHLKDFHLPKDARFSVGQVVSACLAVSFFVLSWAIVLEKLFKG